MDKTFLGAIAKNLAALPLCLMLALFCNTKAIRTEMLVQLCNYFRPVALVLLANLSV